MTTDVIFTVIQIIVGIIITAAVPWAFVMERRLARIEAKMSNGFSDDIGRVRRSSDRLSDTVKDHEKRIIKLEVKAHTDDN